MRLKCLILGLLAVATMSAAPTITHSGDTLVITVNAGGDLKTVNFSPEELAAKNVKIVTADGVTLSTSDFTDFFGASYTTPPFSMITELDLGQAELENDRVITPLGQNSKCTTCMDRLCAAARQTQPASPRASTSSTGRKGLYISHDRPQASK